MFPPLKTVAKGPLDKFDTTTMGVKCNACIVIAEVVVGSDTFVERYGDTI